MIIDPLKIVLFPGGCSGHFVADWLTVNESAMRDAVFQIDHRGASAEFIQTLSPPIIDGFDPKFQLGMINDIESMSESERQTIIEQIAAIPDRKIDVLITHITDKIGLSKMIPFEAYYISIWPTNNRFGWIKNAYYKNMLDMSLHDDRIGLFEHLLRFIEMYDKGFDALDCRMDDIFDFDLVQDIDALISLYEQVNGTYPSDHKIQWAKRYISKQFKAINPPASNDFDILFESIAPADLFDIAILVYLYEKTNPALKRMWTVDSVPDDFIAAKDFILRNRMNYYR